MDLVRLVLISSDYCRTSLGFIMGFSVQISHLGVHTGRRTGGVGAGMLGVQLWLQESHLNH